MGYRWYRLAEVEKELKMADSSAAYGQVQASPKPKSKSTKEAVSTSYCQWSVLPNDAFMPSGPKVPTLDAGVYNVGSTDAGPIFIRAKLITDDLVTLEDSANERVLASMQKFWQSKAEYTKRGIVYKRGILLDGPAGSGKTSTVNLLTKILIGMDGIVLICGNPIVMADALSSLRRIEPDRNLIVIYEDIDELIKQYNEHAILSLLDGEAQIDNVVNIACPAPETLILKSDLTWVPAGELQVGDELIGFDEKGVNKKYRTAVVNSCPIINKPRYMVKTGNNTIVVSEKHPFLVQNKKKMYEWREVENLQSGDLIASVGRPWETDDTRDGGYLAAQFDAEGNLNFSRNQHESLSFRASWAQSDGPVVAEMERIFSEKGIEINRHNRKPIMGIKGRGMGVKGPHKPLVDLAIGGGKWETLRFLGTFRPLRLLADKRLRQAWEDCRLCADFETVISVEPTTNGPVVALDTTTHTFIGEGLLQHNTTNFPEELGARICNRPSRFDERITVGMPTTPARNTYLHHILREETISEDEIQKWVKDTEGFSVAHLKELAIAVFCLQQPYDTVLTRLKAMQIRPRGIPEFRSGGKRGFELVSVEDR